MALFLTEQEVTALLDLPTTIEVVEKALRDEGDGRASNRPRQGVPGAGGVLHAMIGGIPSLGMLGLKAYTRFFPRPGHLILLLYDARTGELLSLMEAKRLSQIRTGAASAIATRYMARPEAGRLALFGAGWQAEAQLEAICLVRRISEVRVCSRGPERLARFCPKMSDHLGIEVRPAASPREALRDAEIVVTATTSRTPTFDGTWLEPGTHINAIGSNALDRREIDLATVRRAAVIAVDSIEQARDEAGDLAPAVEQGIITWEGLTELSAIVAGRGAGRSGPESVTLFESQGVAIEDVATGALIFGRAKERGAGTQLAI